jgi:hypothetical protein
MPLLLWFVRLIRKYDIFHYNDTGRLVMPESAVRYIADNKARDMEQAMKPGGGH